MSQEEKDKGTEVSHDSTRVLNYIIPITTEWAWAAFYIDKLDCIYKKKNVINFLV